jgi:uncharacterized protein (UPF0335 family)
MKERAMQNSPDGELLRGFLERYERLESDKSEISDDQKVVVAEVRAAGFNVGAFRHCVKVRKKKPGDFHEARALADMYLSAIGVFEPPLFRAAGLISCDRMARESVVAALTNFVPDKGAIIIEAPGGIPLRLSRGEDGEVTVEEHVVDRGGPADGGEGPGDGKARKGGRGKRAAEPPPDVDEAGAMELGRAAAVAGAPIIANPFPFNDKRRASWDIGWRAGAGNDGMGPQ